MHGQPCCPCCKQPMPAVGADNLVLPLAGQAWELFNQFKRRRYLSYEQIDVFLWGRTDAMQPGDVRNCRAVLICKIRRAIAAVTNDVEIALIRGQGYVYRKKEQPNE